MGDGMTKESLVYSPDKSVVDLNEDLATVAEIIEKHAKGKSTELLEELCRTFSGTFIYWPKPGHMFRTARDAWVRKSYDQGYRVPCIARAAGISEASVWQILGKAPFEDKQMNLF